MIRSTLLTLLVLTLIQMAFALPEGHHKIFNEAAKGALIGYRNKAPFVKKNSEGEAFSTWSMRRFQAGTSMLMPPAGSYLNSDNDNNLLVQGDESDWFFQKTESGHYLIKDLYKSLVLDWDEGSGNVLLKPENGERTQLWYVPNSDSYSRMYYQ
ncbi:hypothetical protein EC968_008419 [Mortierella alpina]|nr:hypothetical protein EC968_008419 [Mortierella alpina]